VEVANLRDSPLGGIAVVIDQGAVLGIGDGVPLQTLCGAHAGMLGPQVHGVLGGGVLQLDLGGLRFQPFDLAFDLADFLPQTRRVGRVVGPRQLGLRSGQHHPCLIEAQLLDIHRLDIIDVVSP